MAQHYRCPNDQNYLYKGVRDDGFGKMTEVFVCRTCNYSISVDDAVKELHLTDDHPPEVPAVSAPEAPAPEAAPVLEVPPDDAGEVE